MDFDPELKHLHEVQVREQLQKQQRGFLEHLSKPSNTRSRKAPIDRVHRVKRSMSLKDIMNKNSRVSMQCMQGEDGAYYYIPLDAYNPDHLSIITELSPLLVNPSPRQFETGALYTYIVASIIYKDPNTHEDIEAVPMKLYTSKAINMFEFGTKHHQIFYRMATTSELHDVARQTGIDVSKLQYALHASGEIHCINPNTLEFNFYSGTYKMQRVIPRKRAPYKIALITKLMQGINASYDISFEFKPFIVPELMPIKHDQLRHLESMGIPVFGFATREKCRDMRIAVIRHKNLEKKDMTHTEMRSHYARLVAPTVQQPAVKHQQPVQVHSSVQPSRIQLHAMSLTELRSRAAELAVPIPPEVSDRKSIIDAISKHLTAGKGGKKRTFKNKKKQTRK